MTIREEHFSSAHFIRYSGYPSPTLSFRAQREIFLALCSFLLLSQKVSPFPLSHIRHYPLLQERSLDFARDDDTGIALSKHIRCTLRGINPFPPYRHEGRSEKSSLHSVVPYSFHGRFPIFRYPTYSAIPMCKKDPSTSVGMTMRMALCSRYFHAVTPKSASSRHIDPSLWPAPSLRKSKKGS